MKPQVRFLQEGKRVAFYGLKRGGSGFANQVFDSWRKHTPDLEPVAVRPDGEPVDGLPSVRSSSEIDPLPDLAVVMLNPQDAQAAIDDAARSRLRRIWLVLNAASRENVALARDLGLDVAVGCPLMYMPNAGFVHRLHGWFANLFTRL